jgi:ABC-type glutathione transport system ATPase component
VIQGAPVVDVQRLTVSYGGEGQPPAVDTLTFAVSPGEAFGLVGESGSGKTTTVMAVLGLLKPPARVDSGEVRVNGIDVLTASPRVLRRMRWRDIAFVPQGAMNALNPVAKIGKQIRECFDAHPDKKPRGSLKPHILQRLGDVGLEPEVYELYPHELSGGMKQRVCIAMATALEPSIIVADEPTSSLDVVVQRQVIESIRRAQSSIGASLLFIGHDLALQAKVADRIGVMHRGRLVEIGPAEAIFAKPMHWYTQMLITSIPPLPGREAPPVKASVTPRRSRGSDEAFELRPVGDDHYAAVSP